MNLAGPDGPVVAGGPVLQESLEQAVLIQTDSAGQSAAVGTLSPFDCYPVGPAGPCVAGGPVGPDVCLKDPKPLTHAVLIHADPAGQHAAAVGTRSPSDCYPAGPAGPYVAGALLAQVIVYKFWNRSSNWFWTMLTQPDSMPLFWILQNR